MKIVHVLWIDSVAKESWHSEYDVTKLLAEPEVNESVGFLMRRDKEGILLCMSRSTSETEAIVGNALLIPKVNIKRVRVLAEN